MSDTNHTPATDAERIARVRAVALEAQADGSGAMLMLVTDVLRLIDLAKQRNPPAGDDDLEYGFDAPSETSAGALMFVTRSEYLADILHVARPEAPMFVRPATAWTQATD